MIYKMAGYGVDVKKEDPHYAMKLDLEGWTETSYGFLAGPAYSIPFAILLLFTGVLADFSNRTYMVTISCIGWSACLLGMSFVKTMSGLIALRMG